MPLARFPLSRFNFIAKIASALALFGTTWRFLHDYTLPLVFIFLPIVLIMLPILERFTPLLVDKFTRDAVFGVAAGVSCGFLSTVSNVYRSQLIVMSPSMVESGGPLCSLELLHIPVILLSWVDSFLRLLSRLPTQQSLKVAAVTALVLDLTILAILNMVSSVDLDILEMANLFLFIYVHTLLVACLPLFQGPSRAWVLLLISSSIWLQWQIKYLGVATWSLERYNFPIPGFLMGFMYVFNCNEHAYSNPQLFINKRTFKLNEMDIQNLTNLRLFWVAIALILERIALHGIYQKHSSLDLYPASIVLLVHAYLMSPLFNGNRSLFVLNSIASLMSYLICTLVHIQLYNALIADVCVALCLVDLVNGAPPPKHEDLPRVKLAIL